jgi:hypothetical protein
MTSCLEYHDLVRRRIPASVAVCGLLLLSAFVSISSAQVHGTPSSVTSEGFGGRAINGAPPSVTSLGSRGFAPNSRPTFPSPSHHNDGHPHHHSGDGYDYPYGTAYYALPVPYAVDNSATDANDDPDYQGGPTIFDRRGPGADAYIPPANDFSSAHSNQNAADVSSSEPAPEPTLLSFKDGHRIEVGNYAIVGPTLFDLTPGHARKVALADLDLDATQKLNDDRGISFQLPPTAQAN